MKQTSADKSEYIVLLYCQYALKKGEQLEVTAQEITDVDIKTKMMPCSSKVQAWELLKLLDEGAAAIELVVCPDNGCRNLIGSRRAGKRVAYAQSLLEEIGGKKERLGITMESNLSAKSLIELALRRYEQSQAAVEEGRNT